MRQGWAGIADALLCLEVVRCWYPLPAGHVHDGDGNDNDEEWDSNTQADSQCDAAPAAPATAVVGIVNIFWEITVAIPWKMCRQCCGGRRGSHSTVGGVLGNTREACVQRVGSKRVRLQDCDVLAPPADLDGVGLRPSAELSISVLASTITNAGVCTVGKDWACLESTYRWLVSP
jgi:hypothetical protein